MAKKGARRYSPNDQRAMSLNPQTSMGKATIDNRANQMNSMHPAYLKSRDAAVVSTGFASVGEGLSADYCGFCGAGPFRQNSDKEEHHNSVHHISHERPGCEPCGIIFSSWEDYERHRDTEHPEFRRNY